MGLTLLFVAIYHQIMNVALWTRRRTDAPEIWDLAENSTIQSWAVFDDDDQAKWMC